ncbi:MAG: nuclear transport factor 2 family protein [Chthoniobacterales bacterium]
MNKYLMYGLSALFTTTAISFADDKAVVLENEKAAWQAYKDKNAGAFAKVIDKHIRVLSSHGVSHFEQEVDNMKKWDIRSFTISDYDACSDEKDVIVATYKVALEATVEGRDISGNYNLGSVWKQENGNWMLIFHTAAKAAPATK